MKNLAKTDAHKKAMVSAMIAALGIVSEAAEMCGICRGQHYQWMKDDPDYKEQIDSIADMAIDFAESALKKKIEGGDTTAIIFYLKTKGKRRGYIERAEVEQSGTVTNIQVTVDNDKTSEELKRLINGGEAN